MKFDQSKDYLSFNWTLFNENKKFCHEIISKKQKRFQQFKEKRQLQKETSQILVKQNTQNSNVFEDIKAPIFNLDNLNVTIQEKQDQKSNKDKQLVYSKNILKSFTHSLKVNGVNLVIKYFTNTSILQEKTHGVLSFIDNSRDSTKIRWPGDVICHKYPEIKFSIAKLLKTNQHEKYFEFNTNDYNYPAVAFFTRIKSLKNIPESIKRMISVAKNEQYQVIHISTCIGLAPQSSQNRDAINRSQQQIDMIINSLLKQFKNTENKNMKIVLCCNQKNWELCMKVMNRKENELFTNDKIVLS